MTIFFLTNKSEELSIHFLILIRVFPHNHKPISRQTSAGEAFFVRPLGLLCKSWWVLGSVPSTTRMVKMGDLVGNGGTLSSRMRNMEMFPILWTDLVKRSSDLLRWSFHVSDTSKMESGTWFIQWVKSQSKLSGISEGRKARRSFAETWGSHSETSWCSNVLWGVDVDFEVARMSWPWSQQPHHERCNLCQSSQFSYTSSRSPIPSLQGNSFWAIGDVCSLTVRRCS